MTAPIGDEPQPSSARQVELERELATLRDQRDQAWMQLQQMRQSLSWRMTWPLRKLRYLGKR